MLSVLPDVVDALVALWDSALAGEPVDVSDGHLVTDSANDFLLVGVEDPRQADPTTSASFTTEWTAYGGGPGMGTTRTESGDITCVLYRLNGNNDQAAVRRAAFDNLDLLWDAVRPDASLGVTGLQWVRPGASVALWQAQTDYGAEAAVVFTVNYYAYH